MNFYTTDNKCHRFGKNSSSCIQRYPYVYTKDEVARNYDPPNLHKKNWIKNGESTAGALQSICLLKDMFGKATAAQVYSRSTPAVCPDFLGALQAFVLWIP